MYEGELRSFCKIFEIEAMNDFTKFRVLCVWEVRIVIGFSIRFRGGSGVHHFD